MPPAPASEQRTTLLWLVAAGLLMAALTLLGPILTPFVAAAIIGYMLNPAVDAMTASRLPRFVGVVAAMTALVLLLLAIGLIVLPIMGDQLPLLQQRLPDLLDKFDSLLRPWLMQFGINIHLDGAGIKKLIAQKIATSGPEISAALLAFLKVGSSAVAGWFGTLFLMPFVIFYLLLDWHALLARVANNVPRRWIGLVTLMAEETDALLAQYLRGQLLVMGLLAAFYSVALGAAGFDVALPVGILTGVLVLIPYIGFGIGLLLALIAAILQFDGWHGLIAVAVIYGAGQFIESFYLTPKLVGERIGLHPLTVIFALLAFGQLFGFVGVLLALPASAILSVVFGHLRQHYLNSPFYNQS